MTLQKRHKHHLGFTLLEIIAVLVIFGILAAVTVQRYIYLEENAYRLAIDAAVSGLNSRESRAWAEVKASSSGWISDNSIWIKLTLNENGTIDIGYPDLGDDYKWMGNKANRNGESYLLYKNKANRNGESYLLYKQGTPVMLIRTPSTTDKPARWKKKIKEGQNENFDGL